MSAPSKRPAIPPIDEDQLWELFVSADQIGLRLELSASGITWETSPGYRHQEICIEVVNSIQWSDNSGAPCGCHRNIDVAIRFPNGMVKRPDISIFCVRPPEEDGFIHQVPEAVVEIVSPGYEAKDLLTGPRLYLDQGVQDVLVFDRHSGQVHHFRKDSQKKHKSPKQFVLECGCSVTV